MEVVGAQINEETHLAGRFGPDEAWGAEGGCATSDKVGVEESLKELVNKGGFARRSRWVSGEDVW